jgi:hypothetical protein
MKEVNLTRAKEIFLFDCRVAGWDAQSLSMYYEVLGDFIQCTGDIRVEQLMSNHIRLYISNLSDGPSEGDEHDRSVMCQYAMIQSWLHWIHSQNLINERSSSFDEPPRLTTLFSAMRTRSSTYCA